MYTTYKQFHSYSIIMINPYISRAKFIITKKTGNNRLNTELCLLFVKKIQKSLYQILVKVTTLKKNDKIVSDEKGGVMKVVGLVTEYNPFHNGHLYHLLASKEKTNATHSIAVMSGHFLQRGEPAIIDKWTRARNAVDAGVDLIIEIPTLFSSSSAEYFAYGSVSLLNQLGIVDTLCFGSEDGRIDLIQESANLLASNDEDLESHLLEALKTGISYPKAREIAMNRILDPLNKALEFKPNNILGIEYLKSINFLNSKIEPFTIKRKQADYMSLELSGTISSATGIRNYIFNNNNLVGIENFVPSSTYDSLLYNFNNNNLIEPNLLGDLILYKIRSSSIEYLNSIHDVSEGLEYRIKKHAELSNSYEELITSVISKRFTRTRIQRIMVKILLDITKNMIKKCGDVQPKYARILAFNKKGAELIKRIKKESDFQLITNINKVQLDPSMKDMLDLDIKATNIYNLLYNKSISKSGGSDYLKTPYFKK